MGGIGSGGGPSNRPLTRDLRQLDIRRLAREQRLAPGLAYTWSWTRDGETVAWIWIRTEEDRLVLDYQRRLQGGEWLPWSQSVELDRVPCNFGGTRPRFVCPGCYRRVDLLYLSRSGSFSCRRCCGLVYASQRESVRDRAFRRGEKIRQRLGWEPGIGNPPGTRPRYMHQATFEKLVAGHNRAADEAMALMPVWVLGRSRRGRRGPRARP